MTWLAKVRAYVEDGSHSSTDRVFLKNVVLNFNGKYGNHQYPQIYIYI